MAILSESLRRHGNQATLTSGYSRLDEELAVLHANAGRTHEGSGPGLPLQSLTDISGPPGSGKRALILEYVMETLKRGRKVLHISCDFRPFPWSRIRKLEGWDSGRFESRIESVYCGKIEHLLLQPPTNADVGLVIVSHYDALIDPKWPRQVMRRAGRAILHKINSYTLQCPVFSTSGCIKYDPSGAMFVIHPTVLLAKEDEPPHIVRIMVYRDRHGASVLSTGMQFVITEKGILKSDSSVESAWPIPSHILTSKRQTPRKRLTTYPSPSDSVIKKRSFPHSASTPTRSVKVMQSSSSPLRSHSTRHSERLLPGPQAVDRRSIAGLSSIVQSSPPSSTGYPYQHPNSPAATPPPPTTRKALASHLDKPLPLAQADQLGSTHEELSVSPLHSHGIPIGKEKGEVESEFIPNSQVDISDPIYALK